jgi:hypothetical protein
VNLTLFFSQLWRYKKQTTYSKDSYIVDGLDKTRSWARCGPRAVVGLLPLQRVTRTTFTEIGVCNISARHILHSVKAKSRRDYCTGSMGGVSIVETNPFQISVQWTTCTICHKLAYLCVMGRRKMFRYKNKRLIYVDKESGCDLSSGVITV